MLWDVFENRRGPCTLSPQICEGLPTSTRQMLWDVSGAHVVASIHIHSPGPQALSINQVRRPYQYTWSACRVKSPGPQALLIHQVRRPYSLQQFSCTHLGRKSPRRHLEDHLPFKRNQHCWLSFCMTHAWLCPVSSDLSHIGVDNDKNNTDPQFCSLFSYLDDNNKDCKCQRGKVRQSSLNHRSLL